MDIDHIDIVVTHKCNFNCPFCIDKFSHSSDAEVSLEAISKFLDGMKKHAKPGTEVLLLGGEPTMLETQKLIDIAKCIKDHGFSPIMSTNGSQHDKIVELIPYFDWIQITILTKSDIERWEQWPNKINIKLSGDAHLDMHKYDWFKRLTKNYTRRSISMYFTPDFKELCEDEEIWNMFNGQSWSRNGSYEYTFIDGIRVKRCIHGETNIIDEPTVPKLYPNGNYNKTWRNEEMDDYLDINKKVESCNANDNKKHYLKRFAISMSELMLAGCLVESAIAVLFMWFLISCITTFAFLLNGQEEDGKKIDYLKLLQIEDGYERQKIANRCVKWSIDNLWLQTLTWLWIAACVAKLVAMLLCRWLGVEISTWL